MHITTSHNRLKYLAYVLYTLYYVLTHTQHEGAISFGFEVKQNMVGFPQGKNSLCIFTVS